MKIRTKKRIAAVVGLFLFLLTIGIVGGMELGSIETGKGAALAIMSETAGIAALWKAGVVKL